MRIQRSHWFLIAIIVLQFVFMYFSTSHVSREPDNVERSMVALNFRMKNGRNISRQITSELSRVDSLEDSTEEIREDILKNEKRLSNKVRSVINSNDKTSTLLSSSRTSTCRQSKQVLFRPFSNIPKYHNTTVHGNALPGPFLHDRLFLQGLRLTTSYEKDDFDVNVDVFGFPGDFVGNIENKHCDIHSQPQNWDLMKNDDFQKGNKLLYCQLECVDDHDNSCGDCGEPIPMSFIPLLSADANQNKKTLIWRCNVTQFLDKQSLFQPQDAMSNRDKSIRVSLYLKEKTLDQKSFLMYDLTQVDIPLHTAVAGHGGPQIRSLNHEYFSPKLQETPYRVGMCVMIHNLHAAKYIYEFLQHHINVGIEHFVVGMAGTLDSELVTTMETKLMPYMEEGIVALNAIGIHDYFQCQAYVVQLQFYQPCLYHFKGLTKYVVTWDVDEYWIPPDNLEVTGFNNFTLHRLGVDQQSAINDDGLSMISQQRFITHSDLSTFPSFTTSDSLWKSSNYSTSISIYDTIKAVDQYHTQHGCSDKWCFHAIPSFSVAPKWKSVEDRAHVLAYDYLNRDKQTKLHYHKILLQTKFAMMSGTHLAGSCKFPGNSNYFSFGVDRKCFPVIWKGREFGSLHFFQNLLASRAGFTMESTNEDEYVSRFGPTTVQQMISHNRLPLSLQDLFKIEDSKIDFTTLTPPCQDSSHRVLFRPFLKDPKVHNTTVNGDILPGPFLNDTLFLQGVRITTSYEKSNSDVHVDVFGFPGDFVGVKENKHCDIHSQPNDWKNLAKYDSFRRRTKVLFCQLECGDDHHSSCNVCGEPIPMTFIPLLSGDSNQDRKILIWRCNVTQLLNKQTLLEQSASSNPDVSLRVTLFMVENSLDAKSYLLHNVTQIDIPLHTAVAGQAGSQIRRVNQGYFSPTQQETPYNVGMCMMTYEARAMKFIPEFLQHHINVGVDHFVIGVNGTLGSSFVSNMEEMLQPYIDEGLVTLNAVGIHHCFRCVAYVTQQQFYHQCLYNYKGLTKYIVTWDVDEYWVPPDRLEVLGFNNFPFHRVGKDGGECNNSVKILEQRFITSSDLSSFPNYTTKDALWRSSNYSSSISIYDTIKAIDHYHKQNGCFEKWCFHVFPSFSVALKSKKANRTNLIAQDFYHREGNSNLEFQKVLLQTRFAMMSGIHMAGSCQFFNSSDYSTYGDERKCFPLVWRGGEFGALHHFKNLIATRADFDVDTSKPDEYISRFGNTVVMQLQQK